jgi:GAF domain-containing protein/HAMP domain-containing protein
VDGQFYGITGVDLRVDFLQQLADDVSLQDRGGKMAIISSQGTLAGVTGQPEMVGESGSAFLQFFDEIQPRLESGEKFILSRPEENLLAVFIPINFGNTDITWSVGLTLPLDVVTAGPTATMWRLVGIGAVLTLVGLILLGLAARQIARPIKEITDVAQEVAAGNFEKRVEVKSQDEIGVLAVAFNSMTDQLQELVGSLEDEVTARTHRMEMVTTLGERLLALLDLDQLLDEMVNQVKDRFDYYHAHVYLADEERRNLVVAAGAGEAGATMKAKGHRIPLDAPTSLVARAARTGEVVSVDNVREVEDWLPNPLLPDTYSEMAVPIILEGRVVGVLDVQEDEIAGLDEGDANLLRSLANQVAVAIRNAGLFEEVKNSLAEAQAAQERYLEQSWQQAKVASASRSGQYHYARSDAPHLDEATLTAAKRMALTYPGPTVVTKIGPGPELEETQPVEGSKIQHPKPIVAPIKLRNTAIGALQLHPLRADQSWSEDDLAVVEAVVDELAQSAESLRLFEETQERAGREATIREITDKLRAAPDLNSLVNTAARELGERLGVPHLMFELGRETEALRDLPKPGSSGNGNGQSS